MQGGIQPTYEGGKQQWERLVRKQIQRHSYMMLIFPAVTCGIKTAETQRFRCGYCALISAAISDKIAYRYLKVEKEMGECAKYVHV